MKDSDILNFYRTSLFGNLSDPITAACKRAYRDFCRTIDFEKKSDHSKAVEKVASVFHLWLTKLSGVQSVEEYDKWHEDLSKEIKKAFVDATLSVGQIQKWINMTMKYLIILKQEPENDIKPFLHVPIDSIILEKSGHANYFSPETWSQISDRNKYMDFQNLLRKKHKVPIEWEFKAWNDANNPRKRPAKDTSRYERYNYYNGEEQNPFDPNSTSGRFWHGEMMYDQLQDKNYYTQEAKNWRKELEESKPDCSILHYDDVTLGIILYTHCLYGKFCPYGSFDWVFEYKVKL